MYPVDVYLRVRRAVMVDGMSIREVSRVFGLHRDTVRKILAYSAPPGYRRQNPPRRPKLEPFTGVIDQILADDLRRPRKQRHTAQRIFQRLRDEHGFGGQYTIALRARGVKIRSLDETEGWTQFFELEPDDPMAFVGHQMVSMAAWVADQDREVGRRRTR